MLHLVLREKDQYTYISQYAHLAAITTSCCKPYKVVCTKCLQPLGSIHLQAYLAGIFGCFRYLGEAAAQIFSSTKSDVDWEGTSSPFVGSISHHNEVDRLRVLYNVVQGAKKQLEGCTNPDAANFDPNATADDGELVCLSLFRAIKLSRDSSACLNFCSYLLQVLAHSP